MADHPLDCIQWTGAVGSTGYGVKRRDGELQLAHRIAWMAEHGPIPHGFVIHHRCGNRLCIRVDHLDCMSRGDHTRFHGKPKKAACVAGHDLTAPGSRTADGNCRLCRNRRNRDYYARSGKAKRDARLGITPRA